MEHEIAFVSQLPYLVTGRDGRFMAGRVYASQQAGGLWQGWLVFFPMDGGRSIATDRETTQSTLDAIGYWAGGLTPVYVEGAVERAYALLPEVQLARQTADAERRRTQALAEAAIYERAAAAARAEAMAAARVRDEAERQRG
jgi:hypothetical protein